VRVESESVLGKQSAGSFLLHGVAVKLFSHSSRHSSSGVSSCRSFCCRRCCCRRSGSLSKISMSRDDQPTWQTRLPLGGLVLGWSVRIVVVDVAR
jgi:hypothetical protein